ncbi:autotransporter assembly complex protein TamA [Pseudorhodoferax sp.]|uniref:autotransporter assembly complex protein TamA n=1 Tax=Pseudorhodoferax sp. TaxID=1993553 RepID=UPI0039E36F54
MSSAVVMRTPARWPAFLFLVLILQGCSLLRPQQPDGTQAVNGGQPAQDGEQAADKGRRDAFAVEVRGPKPARELLERHLDLQRYRTLDDLTVAEISRLMAAAEPNARQLLGTLGYFTPQLTLELQDTPGGEQADHLVVVTVDPGPATRVGEVQLDFEGDIATGRPEAQAQRGAIERAWPLRSGAAFTQADWDAAKSAAQRALTARRYPLGRIADSRAQVDADRQLADLAVRFDSGPAYRFGALRIRGSERYDPVNGVRIAQLPTGQEYDQQKLLDTQTRLASSGFYESVFLTLETDGTDPQAVPVIAQVREAPLQKLVFGVGYTTDSGPRLSIDHIHNKIPLLDWRAVSRLSLDNEAQSLGTQLFGKLDERLWRWFASGRVQRERSGSFDVTSGNLRYGRSKSTDHIDRSWFGQYDYARSSGADAPPPASTLSMNWGWTGRYFDDNQRPRSGQGLQLEVGLGTTLLGGYYPYNRTVARWLGYVPLYRVQAGTGPDSRARRARLQLRAEAGAVLAADAAQIPSTQLFLTGGDTTVRGFGYRQIGARYTNDTTVAGRYMAVGSVELQHPIVWNGALTDFEAVAFVDTGSVADRPADFQYKVGAGGGIRWYSPVGLVQADLAHGFGEGGINIHLRLGFTF